MASFSHNFKQAIATPLDIYAIAQAPSMQHLKDPKALSPNHIRTRKVRILALQ